MKAQKTRGGDVGKSSSSGEACEDRMASIERRLEAMEAMMARAMAAGMGGGPSGPSPQPLPAMTTKQHATLQMLMRGAGNREIAERFGVTTNTAKVHVRSLFTKFGVNTRAGVVLRAMPTIEGMDYDSYRRASGGLPKDWDKQYDESRVDPFAQLYASGG